MSLMINVFHLQKQSINQKDNFEQLLEQLHSKVEDHLQTVLENRYHAAERDCGTLQGCANVL